MKNTPEIIYLNIGTDEIDDFTNNFKNCEQVTWCSDRQYKSDIAYVLQANYNKLKELFEEVLKEYVDLSSDGLSDDEIGQLFEYWRTKARLPNVKP